MSTHHKQFLSYRLVAVLVILAMLLAPVASQVSVAAPAAADPDPGWPVGTGPCVMPCGTLTDANLRSLISQMTVSEEDGFVHGGAPGSGAGEAGSILGVARLGIPPLHLTDGPAGVRLSRQETAMPAPVGLTASWNTNLAHLFGATVADAGRATGEDVWLAPMMNLVTIPTAGRNFETVGEDPYLASQMAAGLAKGTQDRGFIAQLKHYIANDFENGRSSTSVYIDERTLHENQLQPFEAAAKAGGMSVMCSYNRINLFVTPPTLGQGDVYACSNDLTLNQILKGLLAFPGFVTSDWGATHRVSDIIYGLDMEQSGSGNLGNTLVNAVNNGTSAIAISADSPAVPAYPAAQWKTALDNSVFRILKAENAAGYLEGTQYGSKFTGTPAVVIPTRPVLSDLQAVSYANAQAIAEESATLLKNDGNLLPLTSSDFADGGVLVMGPTAFAPYSGGGGSAHVTPYPGIQSPYDALVGAAGSGANIDYTFGYLPSTSIDGWLVPTHGGSASDPDSNPGLLRTQASSGAVVPPGTAVTPCSGDGCADPQNDQTVNYSDLNPALTPGTGWVWQGSVTAPATGGPWQLRICRGNNAANSSNGAIQLFASTTPFVGAPTSSARVINVTAAYSAVEGSGQTSKCHNPGGGEQSTSASGAGTSIADGATRYIELRAVSNGTSPLRLHLEWAPTTGANFTTQALSDAVEKAASANKVVIFAYDEGTEGSDRGGNAIANGLALPGNQDTLIAQVQAANPNTIVVLNTGDAVFMPWANSIQSILEMWYPGQMGGVATANVLVGTVNPGGKLPETFFDGDAPVGQRFPQDTQPAACENNTASYGSSGGSVATRTNWGQCPMYPGVYLPNNLSNGSTGSLHGFRTINFSDQPLPIQGGNGGTLAGNGIFIGYRWFDKNDYTPLFPFGHGLSYATFDYSDLKVALAGDGVDVSFNLKNSGSVAGDEVPQVYIGAPSTAPVPMVVKALAAFDRITLNPGETKSVTLHIGERQLSYWSTATHNWALVLGDRPIFVGSSSRDIRLTGTLTGIALPTTVQYSDALQATVSPAVIDGQPIAGTVEFFINGVSVGSGSVDASGVATVVPAPLPVPGSYSLTAKFTSGSPYFTDSSAGPATLTVTQEDARAFYNGNGLFWTSSVNSTSANVTLSAAILDATADPALDPYAGDIRNAKVTFVDRENGNMAFSGCADLPVGLVNPGDIKTGIATCNTALTADKTTGASQYTVGIVVSGFYTRNSTEDDTIITVAQPIPSNFITGGGHLVLSSSAGQVPGTAGSKTNFGFNVKYTKSGTNLQGNVNLIVRSGGHVYKIKSTALASLGVAGITANFSGKANIIDVTDPLNPISLEGNATLQLWMTDNGDPGSSDTLGLQVLSKNGGMWFSSNWSGTKTVEQLLGGGNLAVH